MKLRLVLHNIRSTYNVGAILRTAEGLGVDEVIYSGYTPRYDDQKLLPHLREKLNHQIAKSALGAEGLVKQISVDDLSGWLEEQKNQGAIIAGLENNLSPEEEKRRIVLGSGELTPLLAETRRSSGPSSRAEAASSSLVALREVSSKNSVSSASSRHSLILILGEEVNGIPAEVRRCLDYFLEIPMVGQKESFNVSIAAAIAMWELKKNTLETTMAASS